MSYRTWVNDFQFLDNDGFSQELIAELKKQGMSEPDDGCYSFKVKDINPIIKIIDSYVEKKVAKREKQGIKMYDLTDIPDCYSCMPLHLKNANGYKAFPTITHRLNGGASPKSNAQMVIGIRQSATVWQCP